MKNVYVNRNPVHGPWGGGAKFINSFYQLAGKFGINVSDGFLVELSAVFIVGLGAENRKASAEQCVAYKRANKNVKLVLRVNENDARKATNHVDAQLLELFPHVDGIVFVSQWLKDYFYSRGWTGANDTVITNGVDSEIFRPNTKLNNGKVNILMCHWSDNYLKGQDYAEWIDSFVGKHSDEFTFTYVGRSRVSFKHSTLINPLHGKLLGDEIGKYDVCINASRFDPGPNSVIEPISCGLPTYVHVDGGGGVEFAGTDHVFSTFDELEELLLSKRFTQNVSRFPPWDQTIKSYADFINYTCGA